MELHTMEATDTYLGFDIRKSTRSGLVVARPTWDETYLPLLRFSVPEARKAVWIYWHPESKQVA